MGYVVCDLIRVLGISYFTFILYCQFKDCFRRFSKKKFEMDCMERQNEAMSKSMSLEIEEGSFHKGRIPDLKNQNIQNT